MVAQLEFSSLRQPRKDIVFMLCLSLCLVVFSLYHLLGGATPEIIPRIMLLASVLLLMGSLLALYRVKTRYQVRVVMLDGSVVTLSRKRKTDAQALLDGLTHAMDWHRMGGIEIDAQRASHLRQDVAQGKRRQRDASAVPEHSATAQSVKEAPARQTESRRSRAGNSLSRRYKRIRRPGVDASRPLKASGAQGIAEAQARQTSFTGVGPVEAMKEATLSARLKALFTRLSARFGR